MNATLQTRTHNEQNIIELNFQGPVFELPAGEVRVAAGYQSRRNDGSSTRTFCNRSNRSPTKSSAFIRRATWTPRPRSTTTTSRASSPFSRQAGRPEAGARDRRALFRLRAYGCGEHLEGAHQLAGQRHSAVPRRLQPRDAGAQPRRAVPEHARDLHGRRRVRRAVRRTLELALRRRRYGA